MALNAVSQAPNGSQREGVARVLALRFCTSPKVDLGSKSIWPRSVRKYATASNHDADDEHRQLVQK